jgi:hypothetical protein
MLRKDELLMSKHKMHIARLSSGPDMSSPARSGNDEAAVSCSSNLSAISTLTRTPMTDFRHMNRIVVDCLGWFLHTGLCQTRNSIACFSHNKTRSSFESHIFTIHSADFMTSKRPRRSPQEAGAVTSCALENYFRTFPFPFYSRSVWCRKRFYIEQECFSNVCLSSAKWL